MEEEEEVPKQDKVVTKKCTIDEVENSPLFTKEGGFDGLLEGKLVIEKKGNYIIKARSTIKFIFQIIIGIFIYCMVLSTIMILRTDASLYVHVLMMMLSFSIIGVGVALTLYIFYPLIAPRVFDFHHGLLYTKPLSFYIYLVAWDSIHIVALEDIRAIQIIRTQKKKREKISTVDQTNVVLASGERLSLMIRKNLPFSQTKEDAQRLATRLIVPVWDMSLVNE